MEGSGFSPEYPVMKATTGCAILELFIPIAIAYPLLDELVPENQCHHLFAEWVQGAAGLYRVCNEMHRLVI